jgi:hypothetical protein
MKLPKNTPVFDIGDEEMTSSPDQPPRKVLPAPTPSTTSSTPPTQP